MGDRPDPARLGRIDRCDLPAYYQVVYAHLDTCTDDLDTIGLIESWNELTPLAHSMPTFRWDGTAFGPLMSTLGVFEEDVRDCGLSIDLAAPVIDYHPACPALSCVFWTTQREAEAQFERPSTTPFSLFDAYMEREGLVPNGDCVLYPLLTSREEEHSRSYYLCWLPYAER